MSTSQVQIKWRLAAVLEDEGISAYQLQQRLAERVAPATVYKYAKEDLPSVNLDIVAWILWGLESLTEKSFDLDTLLHLERNKET